MDFEEVIDHLPDGCFVFADPPYYNADQQKFYNCTFSLNDHKRLESCLHRNSDRLIFLLTYDDHKEFYKVESDDETIILPPPSPSSTIFGNGN